MRASSFNRILVEQLRSTSTTLFVRFRKKQTASGFEGPNRHQNQAGRQQQQKNKKKTRGKELGSNK
jgi:hypothetical protein